MENEELDISLLTPGSVWLRTRKGETLSNQVLVLSNLHLSEKMQAKYPPEVVYLDEDGNVTTMPISQFLETRQFHNVNPTLEALVDAMLVGANDDDEEVEGGEGEDDEIELDPEDSDDSIEAVAAEITAQAVILPSDTLVSFSHEGLSPAGVGLANQIASCVCQYSQSPLPASALTAHVIEFDYNKLQQLGLTHKTIESLFDPESRDLIPSFVVHGPNPLQVDWSSFLGVFPVMSLLKNRVALYLGTDTLGTTVEEEIAAIEADLARTQGQAEPESEPATATVTVGEVQSAVTVS